MQQIRAQSRQAPCAHDTKGADLQPCGALLDFKGAPRFNEVRPGDVRPALEAVLDNCRETIVRASSLPERLPGRISWDEVMPELEEAEDRLSRLWSVVSHLNAVSNTPELRQAHDECLPLLTEYQIWSGQYRPYYELLKRLRAALPEDAANAARRRALELGLRGFTLSGIDLPSAEQQRLKELDTRLARLESDYSNHVLDATDDFTLELSDESDLEGLPEDNRRAAAANPSLLSPEPLPIYLNPPVRTDRSPAP